MPNTPRKGGACSFFNLRSSRREFSAFGSARILVRTKSRRSGRTCASGADFIQDKQRHAVISGLLTLQAIKNLLRPRFGRKLCGPFLSSRNAADYQTISLKPIDAPGRIQLGEHVDGFGIAADLQSVSADLRMIRVFEGHILTAKDQPDLKITQHRERSAVAFQR